MVSRRLAPFRPFSPCLPDPLPEQSRPLRAEGPVLANQQILPCTSFPSSPSVPDPAHSAYTHSAYTSGVHRITQVPRKTPQRARSISNGDLYVSPLRANLRKGPSLRTPVLPLGPCISSMSRHPPVLWLEKKQVANVSFQLHDCSKYKDDRTGHAGCSRVGDRRTSCLRRIANLDFRHSSIVLLDNFTNTKLI